MTAVFCLGLVIGTALPWLVDHALRLFRGEFKCDKCGSSGPLEW